MNPTIIILAMIAVFLGFRLYTVLGKRTGHEQEPAFPRAEPRPPVATPAVIGGVPQRTSPESNVFEPQAEIGIRAILAADRSFDVGRFMNGAQSAYRMILEAFWRGDRDTIAALCDADTRDAFTAAIDAREASGEKLDNRLIAVEKARIMDASLQGRMARITLQFDSDMSTVTRDAEGRVIAGSLTDAVVAQDVWTFVRNLDSKDPNWLLDETDVA